MDDFVPKIKVPLGMKIANILLLVIVILFVSFVVSSAQDRIGYLVVIDNPGTLEIKGYKTENIDLVKDTYEHYFNSELKPESAFAENRSKIFNQHKDGVKILKRSNSVYFEHEIKGEVRFYVEKKYVIRKKNGKRKYKTIPKKDLR